MAHRHLVLAVFPDELAADEAAVSLAPVLLGPTVPAGTAAA